MAGGQQYLHLNVTSWILELSLSLRPQAAPKQFTAGGFNGYELGLKPQVLNFKSTVLSKILLLQYTLREKAQRTHTLSCLFVQPATQVGAPNHRGPQHGFDGAGSVPKQPLNT